MTVSSVFDMRFSAEAAEEGYDLALAIGADMLPTAGCIGYEVIRDLTDPGHVVIATRWSAQSEGEDVLRTYPQDPKIARVVELLGGLPAGFLGEVAAR